MVSTIFDNPELIDRILDWVEKGYAGPFMLHLGPTNRCNLHCPTCVLRGRKAPTDYEISYELSIDEYQRIIDEAAELGVRYVQIGGWGEPMMRKKETPAIMEIIKSKGMSGFLNTNGTLFDKDSITHLVRIGWDSILFSLDGATPKINDYLRGSDGAFKKTTSTMSNFTRLKKKYKTSKPDISIGPVLSKKNYKGVVELVQLAYKLGAGYVTFQPVKLPSTSASAEFIIGKEDYHELKILLSKAEELAARLGIRTNIEEIDQTIVEAPCESTMAIEKYADSYADDPLLSVPCFSPWFYIGITSDGFVGVCSSVGSSYKENIREKNLADIWNGEIFNKFREKLSRHQLLEECKDCCGSVVIVIKKLRGELAERRQEIR